MKAVSATVLADFQGLTVHQMAELRQAVAGNAQVRVVKNRIAKLAAESAGNAHVATLMAGPTAIIFINGDPGVVAKALGRFAQSNPDLVIKGAVLDGTPVSSAEFQNLLPRQVLLGMLAVALKAEQAKLLGTLAAALAEQEKRDGKAQQG